MSKLSTVWLAEMDVKDKYPSHHHSHCQYEQDVDIQSQPGKHTYNMADTHVALYKPYRDIS